VPQPIWNNRHLFTGIFAKTAWVSRHLNELRFNKARDDTVAVASAGTYMQTKDRQPRQYFITQLLQAGCSS